jgi:hypothetical protein
LLRSAKFIAAFLPALGPASLREIRARLLIQAPFSVDNIAAALRISDGSRGATRSLATTRGTALALLSWTGNMTNAELINTLTRSIEHPNGARTVERCVRKLVHLGAGGEAQKIALKVAEVTDSLELWLVAHEVSLEVVDFDMARQIECRLALPREATARRLLREQRPGEVLTLLEPLVGSRLSVDRLIARGLLAVGRHDALLDHLDSGTLNVADIERATLRFDTLFALGRIEEARDVVESASKDLPGAHSLEIFRRLVDAFPDAPHRLERHVSAVESDPAARDVAVQMRWELGQVDAILRLASRRRGRATLGVNGRFVLAQAHYVRRRFEPARALLALLDGTTRHWHARKSHARMLLEEGNFNEAIAVRKRDNGPGDNLDEVVYHSLLNLRRYDEAFEMFSPPADQRRIAAVFGGRAEDGSDWSHVDMRMVIAQGGPGDEIQLASTYNALQQLSRVLIATCEPRLAPLLRRSFPKIEFLPVERLSSRRHAGFLAPERPPRSNDALFDLLTAEARRRAETCDRVVLGRSLQRLSSAANGGRPSPPFLVPSAKLAEEMAGRLSNDTRRIGVAWRSEYNVPLRSIHYLSVEELGPILRSPGTPVCLQHDATTAECDALRRLSAGRVVFIDDLDLRDDFEAAAALVAALDVVVGVGTTWLDLAAAVGTRGVMMHPTLIGAWRRIDEDGADYWYESLSAVVADRYDMPWSCAERAAELLFKTCR